MNRIAAFAAKALGYAGIGIFAVAFYGGMALIGGAIAYFVVRAAVVYCVAHPASGEALGLYALAGGALIVGACYLVASVRAWRAPPSLEPASASPARGTSAGRAMVTVAVAGCLLLLAGAVLFLGNVKVKDTRQTNLASSGQTSSRSTPEATESSPPAPEVTPTTPEATDGPAASEPSPPVHTTPAREPSRTVPAKPVRPHHAPPASGSASASATTPREAGGSTSGKVCYPETRLPAVHLEAVHIPGSTLPAFTINGRTYPAKHLKAVDIPAKVIPAQTIPGKCIDASNAFAPIKTTVRDRNYEALDPRYSPELTGRYWEAGGTATETPDSTAPGFGEDNAAGFPKNQYVRPYVRSDGTLVNGYWRNSPSDGLPTCKVIEC
jgi:hypothetical protein